MNVALLRIASNNSLTDNSSISMISTQVLQAVKAQKDQYISFILGGEVKGYEMAKSSINTALLTALITEELKIPNHKTLGIVIGALLHDAGMLRLPKEITEKRGELSDAERQRIHSHPLFTHRIVTRELRYNEDVGEIVLQHHERWDGKGYPFGFAGNKINIGARIISIADAFEAMVSHKPYRNPLVGYQAIKNLLADNSRRFDPAILKVFVTIMGLYPIGSIVRLNNGAIARVVESRADAPLRPSIEILIDENQKVSESAERPAVDLLAEKSLYITKAMTAKDISELNA
jgi:HD-GYP domain-containing protein (c-di-GMP phosphodiesterase class II)